MKFVLDDSFIDTFSKKDPPFGFNGLGEIVYMRTYSRLKNDGTNEKWYETIRRVVEGTYTLQMDHIESLCLGWDPVQAQRSAQEMYTRMFEMKFLPPGRGLWAMGSDIITKKGLAAALNNCGFVSTKNMGISEQFSKPFAFLMDMCMLGVGIGFDTTGAGNFIVNKPVNKYVFSIEDTREGWVNSVRVLIDSYQGNSYPEFDYSHIREAGIPLKTFGGLSSGAQPLIDLHNSIIKVLDTNIGTFVTVTTIVDIMNLIGKCVVSGNVRRCLPEGTLVHTEDGLVPIENIIPGTKAYTSSGLSEISELVEQGEQEVICVSTELGLFKCTEKHKIAVVSGINKYSWKCANELVEGDFLVFPDHVVEGIDITIYEDDVVVKIDENFGWIIGYLNAIDYQNLGTSIKTAIGCAGFEGLYSKSADSKLKKGYNRLNPILNNTVHKIMKQFYNGDLSIPTVILQSKQNIRRNYLNGLYENTTKFYNYQFSKQVQAIHASLGEPYSLVNIEDYYMLEKINKSDQLITPIKFNKLIRTGKICQTYDISVPTAKEFIAGEGLLVHNTAEIAFGDPKSEEFMDLKDYSKNPDRMAYGWTSNNSIFAELGMDYSDVQKRICINGEPGLAWLDNMRKYSRMIDQPDNKDYRVCGGNPCLEQSLEHMELCNLSENFLHRAESLDDFIRTLKFSYLYSKTVTLAHTHWAETNRVQLRNRRIGCSVSGVAQFLTKNNLNTLNQWLDSGYNEIKRWDTVYSEWLCIPKSIKMTSVKPSGTVSLLAGATPGMHYPESRFYIRRMRLANNSPLVEPLKEAGYKLEPAVGSERDTLVVEIPIDVGEGIRTVNDVSMWEQLALAANMQSWWADNQVSCTVTFNPKTEGHQIASALEYFQYQLKGISFLPKCDYGAFPQMPYEEISESTFNEINSGIKKLVIKSMSEDSVGEQYCDGESCVKK